MSDHYAPRPFFDAPQALTLKQVYSRLNILIENLDQKILKQEITNIAPLDQAKKGDLSFLDNAKYISLLEKTEATAVCISQKYQDRVPEHTIAMICDEPYKAYALIAALLYPQSVAATSCANKSKKDRPEDIASSANIMPSAIIGKNVRIGKNTIIDHGAVIGDHVSIGQNCYIGAHCVVQHSLIGNHVTLHSGCKIGQDGFGFAMSAQGHLKVPQIGRVIIQDHVDIGANSCIDRGANRDTMIGEGSKIDNLVQIGHNVVIGRHCVIAGQTGISGSAYLEDFVVLGGQVGVVGHVRIASGAQIAGSSNVGSDIKKAGQYGGTPAKPIREWFREMTALKNLVKAKKS